MAGLQQASFGLIFLIISQLPQSFGASSVQPHQTTIAKKQISLNDRQYASSVNQIFKDNILLNLAYMRQAVSKNTQINWDEVRKPFHYQFILAPGQAFAFHEDTLVQFQGQVTKTTNAHFNSTEGFKSDGYLVGDGVCHLASLINWAAKDAKLEVTAPTNHDFATIPEIPKEFGVSIYNDPYQKTANANQNLYIKNNRTQSIVFEFVYRNDELTLSINE